MRGASNAQQVVRGVEVVKWNVDCPLLSLKVEGGSEKAEDGKRMGKGGIKNN